MEHGIMGSTKSQNQAFIYGGHNSLVSKGWKGTHGKVQKLVVWPIYNIILSP
jgi:hypothetical protein